LSGWGPEGRRAAVTVSFDNLGEVTDLQRGEWEGLNTELYPDTLGELGSAGHEVGFHGWCHEQWAELDPSREAELLGRGVRAMDAVGVRPVGFRPPGGRLTDASLGALREFGFSYCSPAGQGVGIQEGVAILPFEWQLLDAYHYLPRFGSLRERDHGSGDALSAGRLGETLDAALRAAVEDGRHLSFVFHPFLAEPEERFLILRERLAAVRDLVDDRVVWCARYDQVAEWMRATDGERASFEPLDLDATAA
jgi:hypothetical protein